mmetsp:Transcript_2145/g.3215  ORF Transcript_2145/g.3215 Transcript_2145/m.3215 type:complete len:94 (-) Transcript_2145:40-321(-)
MMSVDNAKSVGREDVGNFARKHVRSMDILVMEGTAMVMEVTAMVMEVTAMVTEVTVMITEATVVDVTAMDMSTVNICIRKEIRIRSTLEHKFP